MAWTSARWAVNFTGELQRRRFDDVWSQGDWDYDGDVDGVDAGLWAIAFTGELSGGGLGAIVVSNPAKPRSGGDSRRAGDHCRPRAIVRRDWLLGAAWSLQRPRLARRARFRGLLDVDQVILVRIDQRLPARVDDVRR